MNSNPKKMRVAVIGCGIAGLLTAKSALENDFEVVVFEKNPDIGGIWSPGGHAWPHMKANISKFSFNFTDFQWNDILEMFPSKTQVFEYFLEYCKVFGLLPYIRFNSRIKLVKMLENQCFSVQYEDILTNIISTEPFDKIVVCTGFYHYPDYMGFDKYLQNPSISLRILHVSQYRNPEDFKGKRVMVIGLSHSGSQIASELANTASSVISVFRSPRWIIEKNIKSDIYNKKLPWDVMLLSTKELREAFDKMKLDERHRARSGVLDQFSENNKIGGPFQKDNYSDSPFLFGVSDHYFGCVKKGSIKPVKSEIKTIEGNIVKLYNGEDYEIDELIICTGYDVDFSFLDQALLKSLNYDPKNKRNPVELDGNFVYNSNVKNLAFVGLMPYDVTIFTNEFQAGNQFSQEHRERKKKDERRT